MTENNLKILFTGSYQLSQAISYLAEMMDDANNLNLYYVKQKSNIIKIEVRSRHINSRTCKCYINYIPNSTKYFGVKRYYCECANGNRTIGYCSHVSVVIYYLSHGRICQKF